MPFVTGRKVCNKPPKQRDEANNCPKKVKKTEKRWTVFESSKYGQMWATWALWEILADANGRAAVGHGLQDVLAAFDWNDASKIVADQPTPALTYPPPTRNKGSIRPYSGKPWGGWLTSHNKSFWFLFMESISFIGDVPTTVTHGKSQKINFQ